MSNYISSYSISSHLNMSPTGNGAPILREEKEEKTRNIR
jgi:hypothetical protein